MPWPKEHIKRSRKLQVPTTPAEETAIIAKAKAAGYQSTAAFIRDLALQAIGSPGPSCLECPYGERPLWKCPYCDLRGELPEIEAHIHPAHSADWPKGFVPTGAVSAT